MEKVNKEITDSQKIKFQRTWCEYLTPCPHLNKEGDAAGIMVGDFDCSKCVYNLKGYQNKTEGYVICNYLKSKEENKIYGVYFAYNQIEVSGEYDKSKPYYSRELARVRIYPDQHSQLEAYANTRCPAS